MFLKFLVLITLFSNKCLNNQIIGTTYDLTQVTPIELAAIGRVASMGELYDARSDKFLHLSIFKSPITSTSIISTENRQTKLKYSFVNTLEEKFRTMDISAELKLSILGGLFQLEGSGKFFKDTKTSAKSAKACVINSISTEYERISITETSFQEIMNLDVLEQIDATHVVVGIQWGGSVFVSVEDTNIEDTNQQQVQGNLKAKLTILATQISGDANVDVSDKDRNELNKFNFEIYGDILPAEVPQNLIEAMKFMKDVAKALQTANSGKGKAMKYTLIPISLLRQMLKISAKINSVINRVEESIVQQCVKLFDDINRIEQKINDLVDSVQYYEKHIIDSKVEELKKLQFDFRIYQSEVQKNLSEHLVRVRSGNESADILLDMIIEASKHPHSYKIIDDILIKLSIKIKEELSFLKYLSKMNVTLLDKDQTLDMSLYEYCRNDVYILSYSQPNSKPIGKPLDVFIKLIEGNKTNVTNDKFVAVNSEIFKLGTNSKLIFYRNMKLITEHFEDNQTFPSSNETDVWPITYLQNELTMLKNQQVNYQQNLKKLEFNLIPIGFIYTQLPNTSLPQQIWPTFRWLDVTKNYAGLFFRAGGGGSLEFGKIQPPDNPRITKTKSDSICGILHTKKVLKREIEIPAGNWSANVIADIGGCANFDLHFYVKNVENRPINTAVRIWKRTV